MDNTVDEVEQAVEQFKTTWEEQFDNEQVEDDEKNSKVGGLFSALTTGKINKVAVAGELKVRSQIERARSGSLISDRWSQAQDGRGSGEKERRSWTAA